MRPVRPGSERGAARVAVLAAVAVLVAILALAGYVTWLAFLRQPERSIAAMGHAYTSHDWAAFQPYVDTGEVVDSGIEQLVPERFREGEGLLGEFGRGLIEQQRPALVSRMREGLREAVESGDTGDDWLREQRGWLAPLRAEVLERSEDEARVRMDTGGAYGTIEVRMVPRGGRWVVVEVYDLPRLLTGGGP